MKICRKYVPFSSFSGREIRFNGLAIGARPLWAPLGACGPGPCEPPGPVWAWHLWAPTVLVGQALVGPLGPCGPLGPLWAPWAFVGRAFVGPLGLFWAGPLWLPPGPLVVRGFTLAHPAFSHSECQS